MAVNPFVSTHVSALSLDRCIQQLIEPILYTITRYVSYEQRTMEVFNHSSFSGCIPEVDVAEQ